MNNDQNDQSEIDSDDRIPPENLKEVKKVDKRAGKKTLAEVSKDSVPYTPAQLRFGLKKTVRNFYDAQEVRMRVEGRVTKKAEGAEIVLHPEDLAKLKDRLQDLVTVEDNCFFELCEYLKRLPFYTHVRKNPNYKGIAEKMWAVILSSFDIENEHMPSQMWSFAGLAPVPAYRCKECYAVMKVPGKRMPILDKDNVPVKSIHGKVLYKWVEDLNGPYLHPTATSREGKDLSAEEVAVEEVIDKELKKRKKCSHAGKVMFQEELVLSGKAMRPMPGCVLPYNAWLRSKLIGVMAGNILRAQGPTQGHYYKFYVDIKTRLKGANKGTSDNHRHNQARRKMVKLFLLDVWREWRTFEGLPVRESYQEQYLGHKHGEMGKPPINRAFTREELSDDLSPEELAFMEDEEEAAEDAEAAEAAEGDEDQ